MTEVGSFWARRRAAVEAEAQAELHAEQEKQAAVQAEALAQKDDAEILADMGLPHPEEMQSGDDFAAFMARDVPEHLRRQALRTLWRSNPVLACVDGLNEYDDDYRAAMLLQEPIKTAYQVGKGMLKHIEEMERQAAAARAPQEEVEEALPEHDEIEVAETDATHVSFQDASEEVETGQAAAFEAQDDILEAPAPRRMRFRFDEATL